MWDPRINTNAHTFLNGDGKYRGSCILRPTEIPSTLGKDIRQLRRVFFGRAPTTEPVDFTRYVEEEHIFVERRTKSKIDRMRRRLAQAERDA